MIEDLRSEPIPPLSSEDHVRGPADGPLVILYGDFSCPFCALSNERLRATGARLAFRHFALKSRPRALALAAAAEAAHLQDAFWEMHDALFGDPARTEDPDLWRHAGSIGLDLERFQADRRAEDVLGRVRRDLQGALRGGVTTTPTLILDGTAQAGVPTAELIGRLSGARVR